MRFVEFLDQIDEKTRSRPPREMYHGTSSAFLRTILKQGIVPDPKEKKWAEDPHVSSGSVSRVSLPGSYWTSNLMTAQSSSTNTTGKFPGNPIIIIAMISEGSAFADEDSITSAIMRGPAQVYQELFGGSVVSDAVPKLLAGIYWGSEANDASIRHMMNDPSKLPKSKLSKAIADAYARTMHQELAADPQRQPIPYKLLTDTLEAMMLRSLAYDKAESSWGSPHLSAYNAKVEQGLAPELPTAEDAEQQFLEVRDQLTRVYTKSAFYTPDMFSHTLRTKEPVTYRGANKIICIIEEPAKRWRDPLTLHYGQPTDEYFKQYRARVGKFPGLVRPNGEVVIQPDPGVNESRLNELYTPEVTYLKKYLGGDYGHDIDPYSVWGRNSMVDPSITDWLEEHHPEILQAWMQKAGTNDVDEIEPDEWHGVPEQIRKEYEEEISDDYIQYMMQNDPAMAPSTAFYSDATLLKRETWLVHFSDNAWDIANKGFKYGMDQMDRLGLTTYFQDTGFDKGRGGYNFAFEAGSSDADNAASQNKYGGYAVMFTNAGVQAYHSGDNEDQVMFWGANVDPRSIILISKDEETGANWCVSEHPSKGRFEGDCVYQNEDFNTVTNWVEQNWRQYAKIITGW